MKRLLFRLAFVVETNKFEEAIEPNVDLVKIKYMSAYGTM